MKKTSLSILLIFSMFFVAFAGNVSAPEATTICKNFLSRKNVNQECSFLKTEFYENQPVYHIFQIVPTGFVVVSASDFFDPIVAYSFEGDFVSNPAVDFTMNIYAQLISYCEKNEVSFASGIGERWQDLSNADDVQMKGRAVVVNPLLSTNWNQDKYHNAYCPWDVRAGSGYDYRVPAGCVAIAMAQIMNYYRHPVTGMLGTSYIPEPYGRLTVMFYEQNYNFDAMYGDLSDYNNEAAKLIYHCGVSIQMNYTPSGSGASSLNAVESMKRYFKYSSDASLCARGLFDSISDWTDVLKGELNAKHPIYYSAHDGSVGHAFVLDGYDEDDKFHVNWGWGGGGNGYFTISDNDPSYMLGYIYDAQIGRSLYPGTDAPTPCAGAKRNTAAFGTISSNLPTGNYSPNTNCSWMIAAPEASSYTFSFDRFNTEADNDMLTIYNGSTIDAGIAGQFSGSTLPSAVNVHADSVLITFTSNASVESSGFLLRYTSSTEASYCSNSVNVGSSDISSITDGSGDAPYRNNSVCTWKIVTPDMHHCYLTFSQFELGMGDFVDIYDASTNPPTFFKRFDLNNWPDNLVTCNFGRVNIKFVADNWDVNNGFEIICQPVTAIRDYTDLEDLRVYPNPAHQSLNISFETETANAIRCQMVDVNGKILFDKSYSHAGGSFHEQIDLSRFANGIYFLQILSDNGKNIEKIVVNN